MSSTIPGDNAAVLVAPDELERRLLAFINGTLLRGSGRIDADARLFEDGYIDSLRVLELIAFVELATGRKVPDHMVRLATFRSVRTIAAAFANGSDETLPTRERLHEYRGRGMHFTSPVHELLERNDLRVRDDGSVTLHGLSLELLKFFDATFVGWATELGAQSREMPSRIALSTLERAEFTTAFPQLLVLQDDTHALTPAACYHCYPEYGGRQLQGEMVTSVHATCYRNESEAIPLERQRAFTMREIVFFGTRRGVEQLRQKLVGRVGEFVGALGLDGFVEIADDPFFTAAGDGRRFVQRAGALKLELRLTLDDGRTVAVASFNHHHQHFGSRFGITLGDGAAAHSGCVAFGLERWVLAFLTQHGVNESGWPAEVRAALTGTRPTVHLPNYTRKSVSIPRRLLREGKPHLLPLYALLRTSDLAREGMENSGSFRFADHIYVGRARGKYGIGRILDAVLLRLRAARSLRNRYLHSRDTIVSEARQSKETRFRVLSVPCGIARELTEAATVLRQWPAVYAQVAFFGIDIDPEPLELSRDLAHASGHTNFRLMTGNALDASIYPRNLDVIVSTGLGDFLDGETLRRFYSICHGALRPGGVLVTSAQQPQPLADFLMRELAELRATYRTPDALAGSLRAAGFGDVVVRRDAVGLQALAVARKAAAESREQAR